MSIINRTPNGSNVVATGTFTGTPVYINLEGQFHPFTVTLEPGNLCTCTVRTTTVPGAAANPPPAGSWEQWDQGDVTTTTTSYLNAPITAIEISRSVGAASCSYRVLGS